VTVAQGEEAGEQGGAVPRKKERSGKL